MGERLLGAIGPHFDGIEAELAALSEPRDKPAGSLRITTGIHAAQAIVWPALAKLLPVYPDIEVELSVHSGFIDIVAERFDAGVRLGETIAQDMVAVRIGPGTRMAAVASPAYLSGRKAPRTPHDLAMHNCINLRFPTRGGLYPWEFEKAGRALNVRLEGQLIVNEIALALQAALDGLGIAYLPEDYVQPNIKTGRLTRVLESWSPPFQAIISIIRAAATNRGLHASGGGASIQPLIVGVASRLRPLGVQMFVNDGYLQRPVIRFNRPLRANTGRSPTAQRTRQVDRGRVKTRPAHRHGGAPWLRPMSDMRSHPVRSHAVVRWT